MKEEKIRASLDAVAAACLLQRYLEDEGRGALDAIKYDYPLPDKLAYFDYEEVREYVRDTHSYANEIGGLRALEFENKRKMKALKVGKFRGLPSMYPDSKSSEEENSDYLEALARGLKEQQSLEQDLDVLEDLLIELDRSDEEENEDSIVKISTMMTWMKSGRRFKSWRVAAARESRRLDPSAVTVKRPSDS